MLQTGENNLSVFNKSAIEALVKGYNDGVIATAVYEHDDDHTNLGELVFEEYTNGADAAAKKGASNPNFLFIRQSVY